MLTYHGVSHEIQYPHHILMNIPIVLTKNGPRNGDLADETSQTWGLLSLGLVIKRLSAQAKLNRLTIGTIKREAVIAVIAMAMVKIWPWIAIKTPFFYAKFSSINPSDDLMWTILGGTR